MSSLWTPDGEHNVQPESSNDEPPVSSGEFDHLSPEDREKAEAMVKEMAAAQERIAKTPASVVISTHLMGLYELAAIHLSQQPPYFPNRYQPRVYFHFLDNYCCNQ